MPDRDPVTEQSSSAVEPGERMRRAYAALPALLERHEPTDAVVMAARMELAEACAEAGELESALYQADELVKDAERAVGPEHGTTAQAREVVRRIRRAAGADEV